MKGLKFFVGPCVLESKGLIEEMAGFFKESLQGVIAENRLVFKGSFDKANRSSSSSFRGHGIDEGLKLLEYVKKEFKLPVITDIHLPEQADEVASVVDVVQIPAFLCRQTDMILTSAKACQKYKRKLKIKKGQFLAPTDVKNIVDKAKTWLSVEDLYLTERGTSFGYHNLLVDMSSFQIMKSFGVQTIYDATHSVQQPGALGTSTGGKREQIEVLARAAVAAGADGIFMEGHPHPDKALSDPTTSLQLEKIPKIIGDLEKIHQTVTEL